MAESTEALVLAAVREEVMAYGVRRATATSIARRAGVSRVTVYRVGGTINDLVMSALVSEFRQLLDEVRVPDPIPAGADRLTVLVDEVLGFLSALRASPSSVPCSTTTPRSSCPTSSTGWAARTRCS